MTICYSYLGEENAALELLEVLNDLIDPISCKKCSEKTYSQLHKNSSLVSLCEFKVYGPDKEPYPGWCAEVVNGTYIALIVWISAKIKLLSLKTGLIYFVDKLKVKALNCCKTGNFWKACVDDLALKLYEWKVIGIPPDPPWDD